MGLIFEKYKYIRDTDSGEEELYNLEDDPNETHNIKDQPEKLEQARLILEEKKQQAELLRQRLGIRNEPTVIDEETRNMLRALGYLH